MIKQRYKITVEYDGTNYCGFQKQFLLHKKSIEEVLQNALFNFTQTKIDIVASGRTDAGVHAIGQVIHFDLDKKIDPYKVIMGLNSYLKEESIAVKDCIFVDDKFHARFDAKMRQYRYIIINRTAPLTWQKNYAYHVSKNLDIDLMKEAASFLIGYHDFSSFRDAQCQASSPFKTLDKITINRQEDEIVLEFFAKSFLHHMVRNIVGTLVLVGKKKISSLDVKRILEEKNRNSSGPNAPACGLFFVGVGYE